MLMMWKTHSYEFRIRKVSMLLHFFVLVLYFFTQNVLNFRVEYCVFTFANEENANMLADFNPEVEACFKEEPYYMMIQIVTPIYFLNIFILIWATSVAWIKHP